MVAKQQFNVQLPVDLVRRIKHRAIDEQLGLSELVTAVLERSLTPEAEEAPVSTSDPAPRLRLQPMVHVEEMEPAVRFYESLGARVVHGSRDGDWVLLEVGGAQIGLLAHPPNPEQGEGTVELNFEYTGSLPGLEEQLREAGVTVAQPVTDEGFGRQLQVRAPDGLLVKVNELEPDPYT
ncbi:MAG TPA: VOC family protein [Kineosporiaceae bacterium]|nr:VOC family protein [Kineosporiaceae bacterium]